MNIGDSRLNWLSMLYSLVNFGSRKATWTKLRGGSVWQRGRSLISQKMTATFGLCLKFSFENSKIVFSIDWVPNI